MFSKSAVQASPFWRIWVCLFSFAFVDALVNSLGVYQLVTFAIFPCLAAVLIFTGLGKSMPTNDSSSGWWLPLLPLSLWMVWYIFVSVFGSFSIPAILFHFQYDLKSNGIAGEVAHQVAINSLSFIIMGVCWWKLARGSDAIQKFGRLAFVPLLILNPLMLGITSYVKNAYASGQIPLVEKYVDPSLARPPLGQKRNIVHIFLESTERTLWNEDLFGNVAAPLKRLEAEGFSATAVDQAEMMSWTLAGTVASTCGVPLFSLGAVNGNKFAQLTDFMPSAVCLGDILARDGYNRVFIEGADLGFAGTKNFLDSHGFENALGFHELSKDQTKPANTWGLDDEDVFEAAFQAISKLSMGATPYNVTLATIGGHTPSGYISRSCTARADVMNRPNTTLSAFACTNALTEEFIERLRNAGFLRNTIVVLQSDHLAMINDVSSELQSQERRNTFIIVGDNLKAQSSTAATTMDIYPTVLEALGYTLPEHQAGLGVSLLSTKATLRQDVGKTALDRAILADTALRDKLWNLKPLM